MSINISNNTCEKYLDNINLSSFNEIIFFIKRIILENKDLTINFSINFENLIINTILKTIYENIESNKLNLEDNITNLISLILENIDKKELTIKKDELLKYNEMLINIRNKIDSKHIPIINLCITVLQVLNLKLILKQESKLII